MSRRSQPHDHQPLVFFLVKSPRLSQEFDAVETLCTRARVCVCVCAWCDCIFRRALTSGPFQTVGGPSYSAACRSSSTSRRGGFANVPYVLKPEPALIRRDHRSNWPCFPRQAPSVVPRLVGRLHRLDFACLWSRTV